jgi:hypothetical protein
MISVALAGLPVEALVPTTTAQIYRNVFGRISDGLLLKRDPAGENQRKH